MSIKVPTSLSKYGATSDREISMLPLKKQKKVIFEIANYLTQRVPELVGEIIVCAKANHIVDTIAWGLDGNPNAVLFIQAMRQENSPLWLAVMFDGQLILGPELKDPDKDYRKRRGLPKKITQMGTSMIIDDIMKTSVTSVDDKIGFTFPITLMSFFELATNISHVARIARVLPEDWRPVYELSVLGNNVLSNLH